MSIGKKRKTNPNGAATAIHHIVASTDRLSVRVVPKPEWLADPNFPYPIVKAKDFWDNLGDNHSRMLDKYGFDTFKRHINFYYGQWAVTRPTNRFIAVLLRKLLAKGILPWPATVDWTNAQDIHWPQWIDAKRGHIADSDTKNWIRLRSYALYCGLLWQFAAAGDKLGCLKLTEPLIGGPLPIWWRGRLISQDLALSSLDINRMATAIDLRGKVRILEIGAGYGRLAYAIKSLFPLVQYTIIDIEPALKVALKYLS